MQIISWSAPTDQGVIAQPLSQPVFRKILEGAPYQPLVVMRRTPLPRQLLGHHTEPSHRLTRCEGEQITPASRRDSWREEGKKAGGWRTEQIEMKGILFYFDCQQGMTLSFLLFFSPLVYCFGLGPVRRIMLLKLLVVNLTSFHWLRRVTFFCM